MYFRRNPVQNSSTIKLVFSSLKPKGRSRTWRVQPNTSTPPLASPSRQIGWLLKVRRDYSKIVASPRLEPRRDGRKGSEIAAKGNQAGIKKNAASRSRRISRQRSGLPSSPFPAVPIDQRGQQPVQVFLVPVNGYLQARAWNRFFRAATRGCTPGIQNRNHARYFVAVEVRMYGQADLGPGDARRDRAFTDHFMLDMRQGLLSRYRNGIMFTAANAIIP